MNKFKQERQQLFGSNTFSEERQDAVLQAVHKKRVPKWLPPAIIAAIACLLLVFITTKPDEMDVQAQQYTVQSLQEALLATYDSSDNDQIEVVFSTLNLTEGKDALIITRNTDEKEAIFAHHAIYDGEKWTFPALTGVPIGRKGMGLNWEQLHDGSVVINLGQLQEGVTNVWVGDQKASTYKIEDYTIWFGVANSIGTPVIFEKNGKKERIASYDMADHYYIPFLQAVGTNEVKKFEGIDMAIKANEYTQGSLVIDPYYYATNPYGDGDVVVVNVNGEEKITRLITAQNYEVAIQEGTIVLNEIFISSKMLWGHWNGDNTVYHPESENFGTIGQDEVFVMPDNWASDGVRGIIPKTAIVGKVLGYAINDMPLQIKEDEIALYNAFKVNYDDKVLVESTPQQIVRLQRYAQFVNDYETMYELFADSSINKSYEQWFALTNFSKSEVTKQRLNYEAYAAGISEYDEESQQIVLYGDNKEIKFAIPVVKENGIWKVVYETVRRVYE